MKAQRVLINSLPKSGTHLVAKAVELCGYQEHFHVNEVQGRPVSTPMFLNYREVKDALAVTTADQSFKETEASVAVGTLAPVYVSESLLSQWIAELPEQSYLLGHLAYSQVLSQVLQEQFTKQVFIIRDPRAVLASLLPFILDTVGMPKPHFLESDFKALTAEQRLDLLLQGGYATEAGVEVAAFEKIFTDMVAWQQDKNCLFIKFEDLIGEQGGGSKEQQTYIVQQIADHLGCDFSAIYNNVNSIYSTKARTFRQGSVDGWKRSFKDAEVEKIEVYCKPLCEMVGY